MLWDGQENTRQSENPDVHTGQKYTLKGNGETIPDKSWGNLNKPQKQQYTVWSLSFQQY